MSDEEKVELPRGRLEFSSRHEQSSFVPACCHTMMASFHRQYYSPNHDVGCRLTIEDDVYNLLQEFVVYLQLQTGRLTFPSHSNGRAKSPNHQICHRRNHALRLSTCIPRRTIPIPPCFPLSIASDRIVGHFDRGLAPQARNPPDSCTLRDYG